MESMALLAALVLVGLNGFFVATEFALVKVRPTRIDELVRKQKPAALLVRRILSNLDPYLSATQLGITLASLALGWIGEPAFAHMFSPVLAWAGITDPLWLHRITLTASFMVLTVLHIVMGELAPKSLAILRAESVALAGAYPMHVFYVLCFPAIWFLGNISRFFLRIVGIDPMQVHHDQHSEEEIKIILNQARSAGLLSAERGELLRKALTLPTRTAKHLMVPRSEVVLLDIHDTFEENLARAMESKHNHFPLCDRELDEVIGMVALVDVLYAANKGPVDIQTLAQPIGYIPEMMSAERLLLEFRTRHTAMAVVVDEYGGASGIVTPADVVAAVMGEVADAHQGDMVSLPGGMYDVDGAAPLDEVANRLGIVVQETDVRTVAGHLMSRLGRMPRPGDRVLTSGYTFTVTEVEGPRVRRVRIQRENTPANK